MRADGCTESDGPSGPVNVLAMLCESRMDVQKTRLALLQRGLEAEAEAFAKVEARLDRGIGREMRAHPLWPWLAAHPGLGGVQVARLVSLIGDPRRFPGQKCSVGHTMPPDYGVGAPCPWVGIDDAACDGTMLAPRTTTGVRSLWHYLGLHVVDGRSPKKRKGQRADWSPVGRTIVLMPGGIADSIIKLRTPVYRDEYDAQKERLSHERGADLGLESDMLNGPAHLDGSDAERLPEIDAASGLRPIQIHERARKIAAKKFVGDLLMEWKRLIAVESTYENEHVDGREEIAA